MLHPAVEKHRASFNYKHIYSSLTFLLFSQGFLDSVVYFSDFLIISQTFVFEIV